MRATLACAVLFGGLVAVAAPVPKEDLPPITDKHLKDSQTNLKEIGLAFHNYHSAYGYFPADIVDKAGKPLLSWRVAILPYIEQDNLYKQFKLDEPWDSEHNKKIAAMVVPRVYTPIRVRAQPGLTYYQLFTGEEALYGGKRRNPALERIPDGTSLTGLVFEAGEPVIWTKPQDIPFDAKKPLPKLGGLFDGQCNVLLCDGTVRRLKKDADEKELKNLIMPADNNVIDFKKLEK